MNKTPHRLSPSQINTYRDCPRKWAFGYIDKIRSPTHPAAALGSRVHEILEKYLIDGTPPDLSTKEGKIAHSALVHLPMPKTVTVEGRIELDTVIAGRFLGFSDFEQAPQDRGPEQVEHFGPGVDKIPLVGDHKTTGDMRYALTPEDLLNGDPQAAYYAMSAKLKYPEAEFVDLQWTYMTTKGKNKAVPVRARFTLPLLEDAIGSVLADGAKMQEIVVSGCTASEVAGDLSACSNYGGCFYRDKCAGINNKGEKKVDLLTKLNKLSGKDAPKAAVVPPDAPKSSDKPKKETKKKTVKKKTTGKGLTLYINAVVAKGDSIEHIADYLAPLKEKVATEGGKQHYLLMDYNEGPKRLAAMVEASPPKGSYIVHRPGVDQHVLETLLAHADVVVEGIL